MPKSTGGLECRARKTKYYFNKEANKCEEFIYGGCGGNMNRFDTMEDCEKACGPQ